MDEKSANSDNFMSPAPDSAPDSPIATQRERDEKEDGEARPFGGMSPSEAGQASGRARAARKAKPTDDAAIEAALRTKASTGDSGAARELRAWLSERGASTMDIDLESLTRQARERLLKRLCAEEGIDIPAQRVIR